jgi:hypothetical protein
VDLSAHLRSRCFRFGIKVDDVMISIISSSMIVIIAAAVPSLHLGPSFIQPLHAAAQHERQCQLHLQHLKVTALPFSAQTFHPRTKNPLCFSPLIP